MLTFQRITTANAELYNYMEKLLVQSFPSSEYRSLEQLREYTDTKENFHNNVILQEGAPIGLITYWDLGTFYYAEHFAIDPAQRNGGYGKETLNRLCRVLEHPIILEVELPEEEMAKRRIGFYQRQGFTLWKHPYRQPPYRPGDPSLSLLLMAYGDIHADRDFDRVKECIYQEVYNANPR